MLNYQAELASQKALRDIMLEDNMGHFPAPRAPSYVLPATPQATPALMLWFDALKRRVEELDAAREAMPEGERAIWESELAAHRDAALARRRAGPQRQPKAMK